jgi:ADP-L-glycero-D-manno-heptose 6-epimerase
MNRIIITGGAGFIGSNLVRQLQRDYPAAQLMVIDDFRTGTFANLVSEPNEPTGGDEPSEGFSYRGELLARSLSDLDVFQEIEDFDADVVFHLASITDTTVTDQVKMLADNVEPFEAMLAAAVERGVKLVWASSAATYGTRANGATQQRRPFRLDDAGQPANAYGFSKWIMENLHRRTLVEHPEAHVVGLRYFNVFGPGEQNKAHMASMIYRLALQMLDGKRPRIFHDGEQARDHVYVRDVVDGTIAGAADKARSGVYNLGTGRATTFNQIIAALNKALGTNLAADYFDNPYAFYQDYTCADLAQTKKGLHWSPQFDASEAIGAYAKRLAAQHARSKGAAAKPTPPPDSPPPDPPER